MWWRKWWSQESNVKSCKAVPQFGASKDSYAQLSIIQQSHPEQSSLSTCNNRHVSLLLRCDFPFKHLLILCLQRDPVAVIAVAKEVFHRDSFSACLSVGPVCTPHGPVFARKKNPNKPTPATPNCSSARVQLCRQNHKAFLASPPVFPCAFLTVTLKCKSCKQECASAQLQGLSRGCLLSCSLPKINYTLQCRFALNCLTSQDLAYSMHMHIFNVNEQTKGLLWILPFEFMATPSSVGIC